MMEIAPNFLTDIIDEDIENGLKERIHTRFRRGGRSVARNSG